MVTVLIHIQHEIRKSAAKPNGGWKKAKTLRNNNVVVSPILLLLFQTMDTCIPWFSHTILCSSGLKTFVFDVVLQRKVF